MEKLQGNLETPFYQGFRVWGLGASPGRYGVKWHARHEDGVEARIAW